MTILPQHIKEIFYQTIKGDIAIGDFERWLYSDKELEKHLIPDDYLDLISLSFRQNGAKYELWKLMKKHIDLGEFETFKLLGLLEEAKQKTERLPFILEEFYHLYCKGYSFLEELGLVFGLSILVPRMNGETIADTWDELTPAQQKELLDSFSPGLEECMERVVFWIEKKKIVLTGEQDDLGYYGYNDFRTEINH